MWEFIFLTNDNPRLHIPDEDDLNMLGFDDDEVRIVWKCEAQSMQSGNNSVLK